MAKTPAYQIVYETLRRDILSGMYRPEELLPPEPELERMFGFSRTTIRHAISMLVGDGLLRVRQGYGTQVAPMPTSDFTYHKFHNIVAIDDSVGNENETFSSRGMHIDKVAADEEVAEALEIPVDETVYRVQRLFCLDEKPFGIIINYLRRDFFPGMQRYSGIFADLYYFLQQQYGVIFESGVEWVTATTADFMESQILDIEVGAPLLLFRRKALAAIGPMEYAVTKLRPDKFQIVMHMEGPPPPNYMYAKGDS